MEYSIISMQTIRSCLAIHADNTSDGLSVLAACTADVKQWYMQNGLQLNPDKSEALIIGTVNQLDTVSYSPSIATMAVYLAVSEILSIKY